VTRTPPSGSEHPHGFDFNYDFWFECVCGRRIQVPATTYDLQCQCIEPYPVCVCGTTIDISEARPIVRDPFDIDHHDDEVDRHVWYHSSTYQDWPSLTYRRDTAALLALSELPPEQHAETIDQKCSLALHLGTYAAAVENMLRRMADQDSPNHQYWLHQVEIQLQHGDLLTGVGSELATWFGDVQLTKLTERGARAIRYVNTYEDAGSISLAIDPRVITRVRTIQMPTAAAALPNTAVGEQAVTLAADNLAAAEQLRPEATGVPADQIFDSNLAIFLEEAKGRAIADSARAYAQQMERYRDRQGEVWSSLESALVDAYLSNVNTQMRNRLTRVIPTHTEPAEYHERFRTMAGFLVRPLMVVQQFETATWRTPEPPS
jgi:hypothetical protein